MKMVASVPWGSALREFTPWFHAAGYRLASGNPKEVLRRAFLSGPILQPASETTFPEHHPVVASEEEAKTEITRVSNIQAPVLQTPEESASAQKMKSAMVRIAHLVKEGRLSSEDAFRLRVFGEKGVRPEAVLKAASEILAVIPDAQTYEGTGANLPKEAQIARQRVWANLEKASEEILESESKKTTAYLGRAIEAGLLTPDEVKRIQSSGKTNKEMIRLAAAAIQAADRLRVLRLKATKTADFEGPVYRKDPEVGTVDPRVKAAELEISCKGNVRMYLANLVKQRMLSAGEARKIGTSGQSSENMKKAAQVLVLEKQQAQKDEAAACVALKKASEYKGPLYANASRKEKVDPKVVTAALEATYKQKVQIHLAHLVKQGDLSIVTARTIWASGQSAENMERATMLLMAEKSQVLADRQASEETKKASAAAKAAGTFEPTKVAMYEGEEFNESAQAERETKRVEASVQASRLEAARKKQATTHLAGLVQNKLLTAEQAKSILRDSKNAQDIWKKSAETIATTHGGEYQGTIQTASVSERKNHIVTDPVKDRLAKVAKESGIKVSEFQGLLRWTRQQMSEGMIGKDLNDLLRSKFATPLLKASAELLREVRSEHEGLSGHLYVDAAAYATPTGTEGCERGGLKHRANPLKVVLSMPRCSSCTNCDPEGHCMIYNKRLASKPPVEDPKAYQKNAIHMADAHDSEITASLFNPSEFNLSNDSMNNVDLDSESTNEQLGSVLFGGWEL
jgi:hypothetical protein